MTLSDFELEMAVRLTMFREVLKIKQKDVAIGSDTKQSHLSDMEKGKKQIQPRVIFFLCERYGMNANWFYTGKGEMQVAEHTTSSIVAEPTVKYEADKIKKLERQIAELEQWRTKMEGKKG